MILDDDLVGPFRDRYMVRAASDNARLKSALAVGDWAEVQRIAHALGGVSGMLGFTDIGEIARELDEMIDHEAQPQAMRAGTERLIAMLDALAAS